MTSPAACPEGTPVTADFVTGSYHELWNTEITLAVSGCIEARTGWSIRKFVKAARRYHTAAAVALGDARSAR